MGHTSAKAKQRWNREHYTQVKVSVKPDIASNFKVACATSNASMSGVISDFMIKYSNIDTEKKGYSPNLSSKRQRRAAVRRLVSRLEHIRDNEENYRDNIPQNLQGSDVFDIADQCVSMLNEAIELLESAY